MNIKLRNPKSVVGLACTSRGLYVVVADARKSLLTQYQELLSAAPAWWEQTDNVELDEALTAFVAESGLVGANAVIGLPNDQWLLRYSTMPMMSKKQLRQAISLEMNETMHLPFDNPVFDVVPVQPLVEGAASEQAVCTVMTSRDLTDRLTRMATQSGLRVRAIDVQPLAIQRVFSASFGVESEAYGILHLGAQTVAISILIGEDMYFHRSLDSSLLASTGLDVGMAMNIPDIALEIRRVLEFFQFSLTNGAKTIQHLFVHSEQDDANLLINELNRVIPQQQVHHLQNVEIANPEPVSPVFYTAAGLAQKRWRTT